MAPRHRESAAALRTQDKDRLNPAKTMSSETTTCRGTTTTSACRDDRVVGNAIDQRETNVTFRLPGVHALVFSIARRSDDLIHVPHPEKGRILDLGCGTGIWAMDVAETYPEMFVVGVDLSRIQPDRHPPNCEFYAPFDLERQWQMGEDSWDVVHLRMGWGSVSNWFNLYRRVIAHLVPGGWFEQVEIDIEPRFLNNPSRHSPLRKWHQAFERAIALSRRPLTHSSQDTMSFLRTAGFTEISHQTIRLPLNQWSSDSHQRKIGRWYGLAFLQFIESLDLGLFSGIFSSAPNEARELNNQAKAEASDRSVHSFHVLHTYLIFSPGQQPSLSVLVLTPRRFLLTK
ncbi:S-adenosyl-L-methionine-dependent methyltransferase [Aspergillus steynii IBT 23096]|uniref:Velvet complex subunit laeA n=1 Tax=Aspergillus steynii IBT 23096 TaxID=1392250 RepID=A0A2I2G7A5_9EURO|nr:S-adenosyl-L-methionine-dependent methyltransferase [Aspergillus steynii IBT 23096]PLB48764.1 S-adenosyl-L-methionine-dependent methyltransferase [Aspergillus steynii IBT 23096]